MHPVFAAVFFLPIFQVVKSNHPTSPVYSENRRNCSRAATSPVIESAYIGWPVTLRCAAVYLEVQNNIEPWYQEIYSNAYNPGDSSTAMQAECNIRDLEQGNLIFNESFDSLGEHLFPSYQIPDLQLNSTLNYEVTVSIKSFNICVSTILQLNPIPLPNVTCEDSARQTKAVKRTGIEENLMMFLCEVPNSMSPKMSIGPHTPTTVKWFHNCNELEQKQTNLQSSSKELTIKKVNFQHAGIYTCGVIHNNQVWYASHYSVCVKPRSFSFPPTIMCTSERIFTSLGQKVQFYCKAHVPIKNSWSKFLAKWEKANKTLCKNPKRFKKDGCSSSAGDCSRFSCLLDTKDPPCISRPLSQKEITAIRGEALEVHFTIENTTNEDLGEYHVTVTDDFNNFIATTRVILEFDHSQSLIKTTIGIGAAIGVVLSGFLLFSIIIFCKRRPLTAVRRKESMEETMTNSESV